MARRMAPHEQLREQWRKKAQSLPRGGRLEFEAHDDHVWLHIIQMPSDAPAGAGTRLMAQLLAVADQVGLSVSLTADPTDRPEDPRMYDLVRWYCRFGFKLYALDRDRVALMERIPASRHSTPDTVLASYQSATSPMTAAEFALWEEDQFSRQQIDVEASGDYEWDEDENEKHDNTTETENDRHPQLKYSSF